MIKTLGELKIGDIFYLVNYEGGHISSIETKTVDSTLDIKTGRIVHYDTDTENNTCLGFKIKKEEFGETIISAYFETMVCSDKNVLYEMIENDKEEFLYNYKQMLLYLK